MEVGSGIPDNFFLSHADLTIKLIIMIGHYSSSFRFIKLTNSIYRTKSCYSDIAGGLELGDSKVEKLFVTRKFNSREYQIYFCFRRDLASY